MKWGKVRLDEICEVVGGTTPSTNRSDYWNGDMVWLSPVDLPEVGVISIVESSQRKITTLALKECGLKVLPPGSLVYSTRASIGKIGIVKTPLVTNQGFTNLIPTQKVDVRYLAYTLKFFTPSIEKYGNSTTFKEVSRTAIRNFEIPLPPLPVQKQIADTLDKADALRRKDQELLVKYDGLAQSIFYEMFGDLETNVHGFEKFPLGELMTIPNKLVDPRLEPFCDLLHVGGDNIESDTGKLVNLKPAKDLGLKSGKFLFNEHCILYNKIRPYLNKVALPDFEGVCSADMYPMYPGPVVNKLFLYYVLRSEDFLSFASNQSRRANIPKINREELSQYLCALPPLDLQNKFANILSNIRRQDNFVESQIAYSSGIYTSLLNFYFNN